MIVTAIEVQSILNKWAACELNETQVHDWAEARFCTSNYDTESEAVNEVLARLDTMDMNLTTTEDVPVLIEALFSIDFVSILSQYDKNTDIEERKKKLKHIPLYSRFC